jgi:hypothetical protein
MGGSKVLAVVGIGYWANRLEQVGDLRLEEIGDLWSGPGVFVKGVSVSLI